MKLSFFGGLAVALFSLCATCMAQDAASLEDQFVKTAHKARPSVVMVISKFAVSDDRTPGTAPGTGESTVAATFSGVVIDASGHIATVGSAVNGAKEIVVRMDDESEFKASVKGMDARSNLAVIKIEGATDLAPVEFAPAESIRAGSWVIVIGNPFGLTGSVSCGLVSGTERTVGMGNRCFSDMLQTTAPINPGDAGALLANLKGQLVGIILSTYQRAPSFENMQRLFDELEKDVDLPGLSQDIRELIEHEKGSPQEAAEILKRIRERLFRKWPGAQDPQDLPMPNQLIGQVLPGSLLGAEGIGFACPADTVKFVVDRLIQFGKVERAWVGVAVGPIDPSRRKQLGLDRGCGVCVLDVVRDGPAQRAGLAPDDFVVRINGTDVRSTAALEKLISRSVPGAAITLSIIRNGEKRDISITTEKKD
jgi:serine protease Do